MTADVGVPAGSRAVLIGVSAYEYTEFPPVRAARNSLQAMRWLLADPELCGWPPERITVIANPISAADLLTDIIELADTASGALLLYYVGHGVLSGRGELCLTATSTHPDQPETSGLPWNTLADVLRSSPARSRLSILDCCFAGQAIEALGGDGHSLLAGMTYAEGVYTLTATTRNRAAHVPPADQQEGTCTSFTGELRDVILDGIPDHAPRLTLGDIYPVLRRRLVAKGLPAPSQWGADTGGELAFIVNSAVLPRPPAEPTGAVQVAVVPAPVQEQLVRPGQSRYSRIVTDALRTAQAISEENPKVRALAAAAQALAPTDPGRASLVAADAERIAQSIAGEAARASALAAVTGPLAAYDADRAEIVAQSIPEASFRASALAAAAETLAAIDSERAARLIADAEDTAQSIPDAAAKAPALAAVAEALAAIDPDHAERLANLISDAGRRTPALAAVARAVAVADADRAARLVADAERAARSIPSVSWRASALAAAARALAAVDADRAARLAADAERCAQLIPGSDRRAPALASAAEALAAIDPDHAERLANLISDADSRALALAAVARALTASDPGRVVRAGNNLPSPTGE